MSASNPGSVTVRDPVVRSVPGDAATASSDAARQAAAVQGAGTAAGLDEVGIASAEPFEQTRAVLEQRGRDGLAADMAFTYRNPKRSTDPAATLPSARSLVAGAVFYGHDDDSARPEGAVLGRVARYARADAYGRLARGLEAVAAHLRGEGHRAVVVADQNNLVDRAVAHRAGLGWYGKSANLLVPGRGSWFVLGAVVTDAVLPVAEPVPDGCGSCRRCLDGCPTGAIVGPGVVDARRCLAWLVQSREPIPEQFREALGDRLYGCDDCQEVCPPSRLRAGTPPAPTAEMSEPSDAPRAEVADSSAAAPPWRGRGTGAWVDVLELLASSDARLLERFGAWYIPDRDPRYLRRTALVVLGNVADPRDGAARGALERYAEGDDPMLGDHAAWGLRRLDQRAAVAAPEGTS